MRRRGPRLGAPAVNVARESYFRRAVTTARRVPTTQRDAHVGLTSVRGSVASPKMASLFAFERYARDTAVKATKYDSRLEQIDDRLKVPFRKKFRIVDMCL